MGFLDPARSTRLVRFFETNFYGSIRMSQAFAPIVKRNGGGAIVNILSVASWITSPALAAYATSKTAAWGFTNALRLQLREQGTQVVGVHIGFMDTDMTRLLEAEKLDPAQIAAITLDGVEAGAEEILTDERTRDVKRGLSANPPVYLSKPET
jgi:NAD(P)-dependent dehydrogenase (short-subunit alcohol dehydrogenase family)